MAISKSESDKLKHKKLLEDSTVKITSIEQIKLLFKNIPNGFDINSIVKRINVLSIAIELNSLGDKGAPEVLKSLPEKLQRKINYFKALVANEILVSNSSENNIEAIFDRVKAKDYSNIGENENCQLLSMINNYFYYVDEVYVPAIGDRYTLNAIKEYKMPLIRRIGFVNLLAITLNPTALEKYKKLQFIMDMMLVHDVYKTLRGKLVTAQKSCEALFKNGIKLVNDCASWNEESLEQIKFIKSTLIDIFNFIKDEKLGSISRTADFLNVVKVLTNMIRRFLPKEDAETFTEERLVQLAFQDVLGIQYSKTKTKNFQQTSLEKYNSLENIAETVLASMSDDLFIKLDKLEKSCQEVFQNGIELLKDYIFWDKVSPRQLQFIKANLINIFNLIEKQASKSTSSKANFLQAVKVLTNMIRRFLPKEDAETFTKERLVKLAFQSGFGMWSKSKTEAEILQRTSYRSLSEIITALEQKDNNNSANILSSGSSSSKSSSFSSSSTLPRAEL